ncbi:MAG: response regulator [Spirochaetales bacterium]|nr:response regulator [Spirochaetales bacterium]
MNEALFFIGIYITLSIYHLLIYSGRRQDQSNLLFALFCLCYSFFLYWNSVYRFSENYEFSLFHFIYAIACIIFAVIFVSFPHTTFNLKTNLKLSKILIGSILVSGLITTILFLLRGNPLFLRLLYSILTIAMIFYLSTIIYYLLIKKNIRNKNELVILIGYMLLSGFLMVHTAVLALYLEILPQLITRVFFLAMTIAFSYSLVNMFNQEHKELIILKNSLEEKVLERTKQLKEAQEQKETFFINIAHEIKTPLTIVENSFLEFYKSYKNPRELYLIRAGLDKMKKNIVNFLDLHKLESGRLFYNHETITNCTEMVREAISLFTQLAEKKDLRLISSIEPDPLYTHIDPYAFDRIINNVIENSIKYNKPGGQVTVELSSTEDEIKLCVSDTGIGIPGDVIEHIFRPYYQIFRKKGNIQGLGMGLAIVKEICNQVKAEVSVESHVPSGTTISVCFINVKPGTGDSVSPHLSGTTVPDYLSDSIALEDSKYDRDKPVLLIVEDNKELLSFLMNKLKTDYNVFYALNGEEGLKKLSVIPDPDIIISDIMMDRMDGQTFRTKMKEKSTYASVPFIFLTARTAEETKLECLADGAVDYIVKPFSTDELLHKIAALLNMRKALHEKNLSEVEKQVNNYIKNTLKKKVDDSFGTGKKWVYTQYGISDQEIRVISMLKHGLLYKEIAANLHLSINSVRTYIRRIHKKLNVQSTAQLFQILS